MKKKNVIAGFAMVLALLCLAASCSQPLSTGGFSNTVMAKYHGAGYPEWIPGTVNPNDGDRFRYLGHVFQAQNNPGAWESPKLGGSWFWTDLGEDEDYQQGDSNSSDGNYTAVTPLPANPIPDKVFAPYIDISKHGLDSISDINAITGQNYFILSFIIADGNGNPTWLRFNETNSIQLIDGAGLDSEFANVTVMNEINAIRAAGGEVAISFGGAAGVEFASHSKYTTAAQIQAEYQKIIDKYDLTWMDMNIENAASNPNMDIRMEALKNLQVANPGLKISFQLLCMPEGLTFSALQIIDAAVLKGIDIFSIGIMTMNFGSYYSRKSMGQYSIDGALAARGQLDARHLFSTKIGICPMAGKNDTPNIFTLDCASDLLFFASETSWINWIAMWSANRDNGSCAGQTQAAYNCSGIAQSNWAFTNAFKAFTSGFTSPQATPVPGTPTPTSTPGGIPSWQENVAYTINDVVSYNSVTYRCLVSHTAIVSWEPTNAITLWGAE